MKAKLPWRWMAPEALHSMELSTMSDMWAFGVTAWEIFTMGQVPFSELRHPHQLSERLETGLRLERPELSSDSMHDKFDGFVELLIRCL